MNEQRHNIEVYLSAWNENKEGKLIELLQSCVTPDIHYCDPFTDTAQGLEALVAVMTGVSHSFPGVIHELVGDVLIHHDTCSYQWVARLSGGKEIPGIDYIEFAADDRIKRVVSFTNENDWR